MASARLTWLDRADCAGKRPGNEVSWFRRLHLVPSAWGSSLPGPRLPPRPAARPPSR